MTRAGTKLKVDGIHSTKFYINFYCDFPYEGWEAGTVVGFYYIFKKTGKKVLNFELLDYEPFWTPVPSWRPAKCTCDRSN